MKETRKSRSTLGIVNQTESFLRETFYDKPRAWLIEAREKARDLPKTNFDLGCDFAERGQWYDALFRFRITLYLAPQYPQARYNMGCCYYNLGHMDKAKVALMRALRENPTHADAIFMLGAIDPSVLSPEQRPQHMPQDLTIKFFTSVAADYNKSEAQNQYRGGKVVAEQVKPLLPEKGYTVVDLGCGSGIASIPYRSLAAHIIGVDMTPAMVEQALITAQGEERLFEQVITADIEALGDQLEPASADVVLLVNVVQFVGALDKVFATAASLVKPEGVVAVTLEPYIAKDGFGIVVNTGRFGHGVMYAKQQAAAHGLVAAKQAAISLYAGSTAELLIFRKGGV